MLYPHLGCTVMHKTPFRERVSDSQSGCCLKVHLLVKWMIKNSQLGWWLPGSCYSRRHRPREDIRLTVLWPTVPQQSSTTIGKNTQDCVLPSSRSRRSPWLEGNVMNFYLFRHLHVTPMLLCLYTPYALCHMLHPIILCLSIDLIFIVTTDVICLLIPYPEPHRIYAYLFITHLWLHPQFRSSAAHYAHLLLLASYL